MEGSMRDLSKYRFEKAQAEVGVADTLFQNGSYSVSLNRSYYAIFHAIRAVNALDDFESSKHSGVIAHFNQHHVRTGDFAKECSKIIRQATELREQADYEDFFIASREDAEEVLQKANAFIGEVRNYLVEKGILWDVEPNADTR